jgi:SAM-dependent methyltransferase
MAGRTSAIESWKSQVEAHHQQSLRTQQESRWSPGDFWRAFAGHFQADPYRTDDPVLDRVCREVTPAATVLDVGGGAGRFALPLALRCRQVTVVEPSASMVEGLKAAAQGVGIQNLSIVQGAWEEVEVEPADYVLCAHVVYGTAEIEPFIRKLDDHAMARVLVLAYMDSPLSAVFPFWKAVHGEERIDLPALPQLLKVLWEMDIYPDLELIQTHSPETVASWEVGLALLRELLYVRPDTEKDQLLQKAMCQLAVETPHGFTTRGARPQRQGLISWRPVHWDHH